MTQSMSTTSAHPRLGNPPSLGRLNTTISAAQSIRTAPAMSLPPGAAPARPMSYFPSSAVERPPPATIPLNMRLSHRPSREDMADRRLIKPASREQLAQRPVVRKASVDEVGQQAEIDPASVPLPASPTFDSVRLLPESDTVAKTITPVLEETDFKPAAIPESCGPSIKRVKAVGMLSLEGFDFEEEEEEEVVHAPARSPVVEAGPTRPLNLPGKTASAPPVKEGDEDEASEVEDIVRPLAPLRIPSRSNGVLSPSAPSATSDLATPSSATSGATAYFTPISPGSAVSPSESVSSASMRLAGSSPPRRAPIGTGAESGLGRQESKWRKSMMGLSDVSRAMTFAPKPHLTLQTLNPTVTRRTSQKPAAAAPSSYDSYLAHQRRIAQNRVSCAPTIHSNASIAAETREIADREQVEIAEAFFMC